MALSNVYQATWLKRQKAMWILGGMCQECGIDDERVLQISPAGTGGSFFNLVMREPQNFVLFCANCNQRKRALRPPEAWKQKLAARIAKQKGNIALTDSQRQLVRAAIGLNHEKITYRNQMVRHPEDLEEWNEWQALVNRGLARYKIRGGSHYFWATRELAEAVCNSDERVAQDFKWARPTP